jgi:hypothetical protein
MSDSQRRLIHRRRIALVMCLFCLVVALCEAVQTPLLVRPQGAGELIFAPLWELFGSVGLVGFWLALAGGFAAYGVNVRLHLQRAPWMERSHRLIFN